MTANRKNVYFNKSKGGTGKYRTGTFFSKKNNSNYIYRSAYEYAYLNKLEIDEDVISFVVEPFQIPYRDDYNHKRTYKPDIVVLRKSGELEVIEIKPKSMLVNTKVQRKAAAARSFLKMYYRTYIISYKFITEEDIFENYSEYLEVLKII